MRSGQLLLRDLDRLLVVLGGATLQLAGFERSEKDGIADAHEFQELHEEADFLLIRIAEIGMFACQIDDKAYNNWFSRPAIILASLENKLEILESSPERRRHQSSEQESCLASRALAAWCLVNYTLDRLRENASPQDKLTAYGRHRLGEQARTNPQLWEEAKRLAGKSNMHPSWMPHVWDEADSQQRLSTFVKNVQTLVFAKRTPQNLTFADHLDEWIIGGGFEARPIAAHWRDYYATVEDHVATLRCTQSHTDGDAFLSQVIAADCYQGAAVTFKCRVKAKDGECQPQLRLNIFTWGNSYRGHSYSAGTCNQVIADNPDWNSHEVTAPVPDNAEFIQFGLALIGPRQRRVARRKTDPRGTERRSPRPGSFQGIDQGHMAISAVQLTRDDRALYLGGFLIDTRRPHLTVQVLAQRPTGPPSPSHGSPWLMYRITGHYPVPLPTGCGCDLRR